MEEEEKSDTPNQSMEDDNSVEQSIIDVQPDAQNLQNAKGRKKRKKLYQNSSANKKRQHFDNLIDKAYSVLEQPNLSNGTIVKAAANIVTDYMELLTKKEMKAAYKKILKVLQEHPVSLHSSEAESEDDPGSEDEVQEDDGEGDEDEEGGKKRSKSSKKAKKKKGPKKKGNPLLATIEKTEPSPFDDEEAKEEQEEQGGSNKKVESLWADFLADVDDKPPPPPKPKAKSWAALLGNKKGTSNTSPAVPVKTSQSETAKKQPKIEESSKNPSTVKITKVFEFAGEEVRVEKEVDANSDEAKLALANPPAATSSEDGPKGMKRPSGLSSIMGLIDNKKQKLTTLEKTKLDWSSFKTSEGIDEELESHKKSKHGFLDKQAFLERADVRQFELERAMRMNKRSNR